MTGQISEPVVTVTRQWSSATRNGIFANLGKAAGDVAVQEIRGQLGRHLGSGDSVSGGHVRWSGSQLCRMSTAEEKKAKEKRERRKRYTGRPIGG
jgi:hypothetical protein